MLTWELPFTDKLHWQLVKFVAQGGRPPIPERHQLPGKDTARFEGLDAYIALMQRCWAQSPADRPLFAEINDSLR